MSLSPVYHFLYMRFCLSTHFIRHLNSTNIQDHQVQAIKRCVDSAISLLSLSHSLGPVRRDQLRYFPDFIFVTVSFCSTFILQAIRTLPQVFGNSKFELDIVKKTATLMMGLGIDQSHGAFASGRSVLRQWEATITILNRSESDIGSTGQPLMSNPMETPDSGFYEQPFGRGHGSFDRMSGGELEHMFTNTIFEFPEFFDIHSQGNESGFT